MFARSRSGALLAALLLCSGCLLTLEETRRAVRPARDAASTSDGTVVFTDATSSDEPALTDSRPAEINANDERTTTDTAPDVPVVIGEDVVDVNSTNDVLVMDVAESDVSLMDTRPDTLPDGPVVIIDDIGPELVSLDVSSERVDPMLDARPDAPDVSRSCRSNIDCAPNEFCNAPVGDCFGVGVCTLRPTACTEPFAPVCSCSGTSFGNQCGAQVQGERVRHSGNCPVDVFIVNDDPTTTRDVFVGLDVPPPDVFAMDTPTTGTEASTECSVGQVSCRGMCVFPSAFSEDRLNCGACGNVCSNTQICTSSACVSCPAASPMVCGNTCVNLQNDSLHCGMCGRRCATGQSCQMGQCRIDCAVGTTNCGAAPGMCVDTSSNPQFCGGCTACTPPPNAIPTCTMSTCGSTCMPGFLDCTTAQPGCETPALNNSHCGACNNACSTGLGFNCLATEARPRCCRVLSVACSILAGGNCLGGVCRVDLMGRNICCSN